MGKYLTTVMKVLPVVQARQISDLLQDLKAKGELRDAQDYQRALADLTKLVNAENPKPTFQQLRAIIWGLVRSDAHNTMMQAAKNDIEAVFLQADEIGRRLDDHHVYLMQGLISDLEKALQDQEDRIREYKMKATKNNEFSDVVFNSFARTSLKKIERSSPGSELLFFNNRTGLSVTEDEVPSAYVSEHGKKIVLSSQNEPKILPIHANLLFDEESYGTSYSASVNNNISNIIDGTKNTFWSRTVYADEPVEKMSTVIEFDFGVGKDVNYVIIEGATTEPFFVTEMWGVGLDGQTIDLLLRRSALSSDTVANDYLPEETNEVLVDGWERIDFQQAFVKSVRIKFTYGSFKEADYFVPDSVQLSNIHEALHSVDMNPADIASVARDLAISSEMADVCQIPESEQTHVNSNVYTFSLDNVWFGNSLYSDSGLFVSQPIRLEAPGVISLKTKEKNVGVYVEGPDDVITASVGAPTVSDLSDDSYLNACSVEYELVRDSMNEEGFNERDHFPMPYFGQSAVVRERLVLTKRIEDDAQNDAGALRFCPRTRYEANWVYVFKNGVYLNPAENNYYYAVSKDANGEFEWYLSSKIDIPDRQWWNFKYWNLLPQKMWIRVKSPSPGDVYTVSYVMRTSSLNEFDVRSPYDATSTESIMHPLTPADGRVFMDKDKMIYMGEEGRLHFLPDPETGITKAADVYTQITLRRNSPHYPMSPEVLEYAFLSAPYKPGIE